MKKVLQLNKLSFFKKSIIILFVIIISSKFSFSQYTEIAKLMDSLKIPGISVVVVKDTSIILQFQQGFSNFDTKQKVNSETVFMLGSACKPFAAINAFNLINKNVLHLDSNINNYLPFKVENPYFPDNAITIRMLLTHTSSINDDQYEKNINTYVMGDAKMTLESFLEKYLTPEGDFYRPSKCYLKKVPGSYFAYSNIGITLLAYIIENVTKENYGEYCKKNIFVPLEMNNTSFFLKDYLDTSNIANPYIWSKEDSTFISQGHYGYPEYPVGQLRTSANDLSKFLIGLLNEGKYKEFELIDNPTLEMILTPQIVTLDTTQGFVFYKENFNNKEFWGHNGSDIGVSTSIYFNKKEKLGIIILCNGDDEGDSFMELILKLIYK